MGEGRFEVGRKEVCWRREDRRGRKKKEKEKEGNREGGDGTW